MIRAAVTIFTKARVKFFVKEALELVIDDNYVGNYDSCVGNS